MITFKESSIISDALDAATDIAGIPVEDIKQAWDNVNVEDDMSDAEIKKADPNDIAKSNYSAGVKKATIAADKGAAGVSSKLNKIMYNDEKITTSSIVAKSRNSVLQFPVYVTQSLPVNYAQTIAKLFERVYTTLVQTTLSQNQFIKQSDAKDLVFLKNFHTNLNESTYMTLLNEYYEPIDELDAMMQESVYSEVELAPGFKMRTRVIPCQNQMLIAENARLANDPLTGLAYIQEAVNDAGKNDGDTIVSDADLNKMALQRLLLDPDEKELAATSTEKEIEAYAKAHKISYDNAAKQRRELILKINQEKKRIIQSAKDGKLEEFRVDKNGVIYHRKKSNAQSAPVETVKAPTILKDTDIKKINGMLPYTIEASFIIEETNRAVHFIIGIKTIMHLISTKDLSEDLYELVAGDLKSLRKVRYKSGEIKFMDYVFNVKQIKKDAAKHINYNKRWINTLKRLSEYEKMNGSLLKTGAKVLAGGNIPIPNGTLILTQSDVISMTNSTGIDISSVSNVLRLSKSLFLIAVCIVDSSAGSMRVIFPDSDSDWDVQSLQSIEAELTKTDNSALMQELNKKINR